MTPMHRSRPTILRQDARGWIRLSRDHKAVVVTEFAQSDRTGIAVAAHVGVKYPMFVSWLRHERVNRGSNKCTTGDVRGFAVGTVPSVC